MLHTTWYKPNSEGRFICNVEKLIRISVDVAWTSETQSGINSLTINQWWSISSRLWPTTPPFPPCFSSLISHLPPFPPPCLSLPLKPHWGLQSYLFAGLNLESPSLGPRLVLKVVLKRERASKWASRSKRFSKLVPVNWQVLWKPIWRGSVWTHEGTGCDVVLCASRKRAE